MKRLVKGMTMAQAIGAMAGCHPKALRGMKRIIVADGSQYLLALLDAYEIYEQDLYNLFEVKCNGLVRKLYTLLMSVRMNLITREHLTALSQDLDDKLHFTEEDWENFEKIMRKSHEQIQETQKRT